MMGAPRRTRLSSRLTLAMTGLVLLTATAVGSLTYRSLTASLLPLELDRLGLHAEQLAAELARFAQGARENVLAVPAFASLTGWVRARAAGGTDPSSGANEAELRDRVAANLTALLETHLAYLQLRVLGADGREIVRVDRSGPGGAARRVAETELQDKVTRPYFAATIGLAEGEIYVSPIELNREHGQVETPYRPVLRVATPIRTSAGQPFGIFIVNLDLGPILDRLRPAGGPAGGAVYLVNAQGDYLLHPKPGREFGFDLGRRYRLQDDLPELATALASSGTVVRAVRDTSGQRLGAAVAPLRPAGGPPVAVVETVPREELLASASAVKRSSLIGALAATAVAVGLAVVLARSLTGPLGEITAAAEALARGEPRPVPTGARGEVGALARSFARMSEEVRDKTAALEAEVEERRAAEEKAEQLAARAQALSAVVASSYDAILTVGPDGTVTGWNPAAEHLYGYSADEAIGRSVDLVVPEDRREEAHDILAGVARGERVDHHETVRVAKDGRRIDVSLTVSPVRSAGGMIVGASKTARDISERKEAEAVLAARTLELQRSNAELEQFAYVASHDLQEPLRMVASYTQLLAERYRGHLDERADRYIHYAVDGARRMQGLVNDLLDLSRVGTRGGELVPVDSRAVVDWVLRTLRRSIEECEAEVVCGELPAIRADEVQLGQVFQNLIGNALKFRSDQPPRIRVEAARADGGYEFAVADNGIGIDPQYSETVFQLFRRLHSRERYDGSGIGLAIVKKIVERHGGRVWFDSPAGGGTVFHFTMPATEETT